MNPSHSAGRDSVERVVALVESFDVRRRRRADQAAVEGVDPGVIGAEDPVADSTAGCFAEARAAMAARIVEPADAAGLVAQQDDGGVAELANDVVARFRNFRGPAGAEPSRVKNLRDLIGVDLGRREVLPAGAPGRRPWGSVSSVRKSPPWEPPPVRAESVVYKIRGVAGGAKVDQLPVPSSARRGVA